MSHLNRLLVPTIFLGSALLAACGGGGGSSGNPPPVAQPTRALGASPSPKGATPTPSPKGATATPSSRPSVTPSSAPTQGPTPTPSPPPPGIDWPTWGFNGQRWSYNGSESTLTPQTVSNLALEWSYPLSTKTINTQPIVDGNVQGFGQTTQAVYAGDELGNFYALNAVTGQQLWSRTLGKDSTTCGSFSSGVTGSPVLDRAANRLYVLDGNAILYALDPATGNESPGFSPIQIYQGTNQNQATWSALLLSSDASEIYVAISSHSDPCGIYYGGIASVNTMTEQLSSISTVTDMSTYYGNAIWSWGGESIDPDNDNLYAGVGNSHGSLGETGANSDSVFEVTGSLNFVADEQPEMNLKDDLDIGTTPVVYDDQGQCVAFERKDGELFTTNRMNLQNLQYMSKLTLGAGAALATPAYSPKTHALYVSTPGGLTRINVGPNCTATPDWHAAVPYATGWAPVPVVAGDVVYVAGGTSMNTLYAVDAFSGAVLWSSGTVIAGAIVAAPTVVNGHVYVTAWDGHIYAFGLPELSHLQRVRQIKRAVR